MFCSRIIGNVGGSCLVNQKLQLDTCSCVVTLISLRRHQKLSLQCCLHRGAIVHLRCCRWLSSIHKAKYILSAIESTLRKFHSFETGRILTAVMAYRKQYIYLGALVAKHPWILRSMCSKVFYRARICIVKAADASG